ncbi:sulfatase family protein [Sunxiuqinia sp. sy24]|uniref:sulfatase family protein n=1 Tax=Sunxiuqinia sp. sy24 TaxID=3461495 RepID=UPI004046631A
MKFIISACLILAITTAIQAKQKAKENKQTNFIIIFTDDQGYGDVGCFGAKGFETPNLDRMADEGTHFSNFYVAATVCTPSRASLMTGCYPKRLGLHDGVLSPFSETGLNPAETILPEVLKPQGYQTALIGKWHLGHKKKFMPNNQGFDYFYGVPYSNDMDNYFYKHNNFQSPPLPVYENTKLVENGTDQDYLTKKWTDAAVKYIKDKKDEPFFLYLAHNMPHTPWHASPNYRGTSELGLYGDVIHEIDWSVGEILNILKETGLDKNTIVLFTSDNGPATWHKNGGSAGPLRGAKATTWEGGQRVPFIAWAPGQIPAGEVCDEVVTSMDILPTFAKIAGSKLPTSKIDGNDFSKLLFNPKKKRKSVKPFYYYARNGKVEAIRVGDWKMHIAKVRGWDKKDGEFELKLYNLTDDVGEKNNVADFYPKVVKKLSLMITKFDQKLNEEARPVGTL